VKALRGRLGFGDPDIVVGSFGLVTPEKRTTGLARAVAHAARTEPRLRLLLAGPIPDEERLRSLLAAEGVAGRTVVTGRVPLEDLAAHVEAADVVVHLRYPTARETSGALLRVLAQGRPTVVSDLEHQADLPDDAVLRVDSTRETEEVTRAILALAGDQALRERLGAAATAHVARAHAPGLVAAAWEEALALARDLPDPAPRAWPGHWPRPGGSD
jgi:glycosyltransferase involved in cell wall biosynthesis